MANEEEINELVIARLKTMPENQKISVGSKGEFDKYDLIEHVKQGDDIGKKIVEIELDFLRTLKKGVLT